LERVKRSDVGWTPGGGGGSRQRQREMVAERLTGPGGGGATQRLDVRDARTEAGWNALANAAEGGVTDTERAALNDAYLKRAAVMNERIKKQQQRLKQINAKLGGRIPQKTRNRLLTEKAQLIRDINSGVEGLKSLTGEFRERMGETDLEPPTPFDFIDAALAQAELTPGTEDDKAALQQMLGLRQSEYDAAVASGDPRKIAEAARNLKSIQDTIQQLDDTAQQMLAAMEAHTAAVKEQVEQMKRNEDLIRSQGPALTAALLQTVNGGIGGNAGLGRQFPSSTGLGGLSRA
jgi:hypothetical protein